MHELKALKEAAQATWAAGDYDAFLRNERFYELGEQLVNAAEVKPGERVLDVACGTGNAAIPAARAGATVTGADLTPELLTVAARRAEAAGVAVEWRQCDAEELPFDDASFDVVLSSFGCMFPPRHDEVADQLARVVRPGGRLALYSWAPDGPIADFFQTVSGYLPPLPELASPPLLWGEPGHVRELFEGTGVSLEFRRERADLRYESVAAAVHAYTHWFGPVVQAQALAEADGKGAALRQDLTELFTRHNAAPGGGFTLPADYLAIFGRKAG